MKPDRAIKHFKTQARLGGALGVTQACVSQWLKNGRIPDLQQLRLAHLTGGALRADAGILPKISRV